MVNSLTDGSFDTLVAGIAVTVAIYVVGVLSAYGYTQIMVKAAQKVLFDIRRDLFAHLQTLPLRFFDTQRHGDVMSYFTNDVDTIADALNNSFSMVIQSFIQIAGTLIILYILNWQLSLIVTVCYLVMFWYVRFSGKRSKAYYTVQQQSLGDLDGYIEEMVAGQKVVKVFNHEAANLKTFPRKKRGAAQGRHRRAVLRRNDGAGGGHHLLHQLRDCAVLGGIMALQGLTDVGSLASYLVFVRQAAAPINQFTQQSNFLLAAMAGAERVFQAMDLEPEVDKGSIRLVRVDENGRETADTRSDRWAWREEDGVLTPLRGDVRFEQVDFAYDSDHPILHDINLYAKPGQKIAFVGSTGAGKTTITNLINRFYDVQRGRILYDGFDIKQIRKDDLRRSLGIVLQDTHLFTGTIADNIRFGKLDATREEIERAARIANADSFIRRLPQGYDTMVTSDGANLSQGQRQLLAIARAAVADPPVLILDEATSSIDNPHRVADREGDGPADEGADCFCHRAPPEHGAQRRRDHGAGAGPHHRARQPRGFACPAGGLLSALQRMFELS